MPPVCIDLATLRSLYASGALTPVTMVKAFTTRMDASDDPAIFIARHDRAALLREAEALVARAPEPNSLPLWGVPFAVKDNMDVAGLPTTAGCPAFAYTPEADAPVVARLRKAGAIVIGKTNLDQFATGLNGTRSPHGAPRCVFDKAYISGGSSSGSAVAVAAGLAVFALGTDTAGSGRVPAALNNIVGLKPTPGRLSTTGLVPACRSLDVISVFANTVSDAVAIRQIAEGFDASDPFSRIDPLTTPPSGSAAPLRVGVLRHEDREFFGDEASATLYETAVGRLGALGATAIPFDFAPFRAVAALLYNGPWVAERLAAVEAFHARHPDAFDPVVRSILDSAKSFSAVDAFKGRYALETLRRQSEATWADIDMLLLPTAPTSYTVAAMLADPVALNSNLGHYTNFANLLGLAAIAVPAGFGPGGLPFGVTVVGPGSSDDAIAPLADALHRAAACGFGKDTAAVWPPLIVKDGPTDRIEIVVVGAHLSGMPLNGQLTSAGGHLARHAVTRPDYKLYALQGTVPPKPGLIRSPGFEGPGLAVEVWSLAPVAFARFVAAIPAPLGIGRIALTDGTTPQGFLCEAHAVGDARDVTAFGGWAAYMKS